MDRNLVDSVVNEMNRVMPDTGHYNQVPLMVQELIQSDAWRTRQVDGQTYEFGSFSEFLSADHPIGADVNFQDVTRALGQSGRDGFEALELLLTVCNSDDMRDYVGRILLLSRLEHSARTNAELYDLVVGVAGETVEYMESVTGNGVVRPRKCHEEINRWGITYSAAPDGLRWVYEINDWDTTYPGDGEPYETIADARAAALEQIGDRSPRWPE